MTNMRDPACSNKEQTVAAASTRCRIIAVTTCLVLIMFAALKIYATQEDSSIIVSMDPRGYPPFFVIQETAAPRGIMLDTLRQIAARSGYTLEIRLYPEKREASMLAQGKIDCRAKAREWVADPENYYWTDPVITHGDILVYRKGTPETENLAGKRLITHLGYSYPTLEPLFKSGSAHRIDQDNHRDILKLLMQGIGDAAVMNRHVALWYISRNPEFKDRFELSPRTLHEVGYCFMFTGKKDWQPFIRRFNQELKKMKRNGELEKIIAAYR